MQDRARPLPSETSEEKRVQALYDLELLDTPPEEEFDELVQLAAELCGTTLSAMTLVDSHRMVSKATFGIGQCVIPRSESFCDHAIQESHTFVVEDTLEDDRFRNNALVTAGPRIRFYAGHPLRSAEGHAVGALCIMDTQPRELSGVQARMLRVLANQLSIRVQMRTSARAVHKLALELDAERQLFRSFLDSIPIEAYLKNEAGQLLFYNKVVANRFAITQDEWLGKTSEDLWPQDKAASIRSEERHVIASGRTQQSYIELPMPGGSTQYWKTIMAPIRRATGELLLANISLNMTEDLQREAALQQAQDELEEANRKLRSLSLTDNLTGLWNRRAFDSHLETEVFRAHHGCAALTLLLLDVDNFKSFNDDFGHAHGDAVLKQVSEILRKSVRANDLAVRFGGEEFAVIMPGTNVDVAHLVCDRIRRALREHTWADREVTVSIGIACFAAETGSDELLKMADTAMYQAKRTGKDRAIAYVPEMAMGGKKELHPEVVLQ